MVAVAISLTALLHPAAASEQAYLDALTVQLRVAGQLLDEAADAIRECNEDIFRCLREPEGYAHRIEVAAQGLARVRSNLSGIGIPDSYASSHALLSTGLGQVVSGLSLYAAGLRELNPDKLNEGISLLETGKRNIDTATAAIRSRTGGGFDLSLLVIIAVAATAGAVGFLVLLLLRQSLRARRERIEKEWATCSVCGEVLDQWWTFRFAQVREWRTAHLAGHASERKVTAH